MKLSYCHKAAASFRQGGLCGLAAATLWFAACSTHATAGKNSPQIGDSPPPLLLSEVIQGPVLGKINWQNLKGKVVVLEFWNTRCGPCIQAIPHWNDLVDKFSSKSVVFLGISDDNKDFLNGFLKRKPIKGWLALDQAFSPTRTAFDVIGIPHTVIVDAAGKIAAITHPANLDALHLDEILEDKPSSLPPFEPYLLDADQNPVAVSLVSPTSVHVSIEGPYPQPKGPFNSLGWEKPDIRFKAQKAYPRDVLSSFFDISRHLVIEKNKLPDGLYDITAAAPPDKMAELKAQFEHALRRNWGIAAMVKTQEVEVYAMTVHALNARGLKATAKRGGGGGRPGGFYLNGTDMKGITYYLGDVLNKPVIDETGLVGLWDVDIKWEISETELGYNSVDPAKVIEAARQQLGLELKQVNRIFPVIVVERRTPE